MKNVIILFLTLSILSLKAIGNAYDTRLIPDSLLKNANAVIRYDSISFRILSAGKAEVTRHKVVTILNPHGESHAGAYVIYDKNSKVASFEGEILDANGNRIRRIKKDEISDNSLVSSYNLFQDDRYKSFEALNHSYPYTFTATYTETLNGLVSIERWNPIPGYNVSVEKSIFIITSNGIKVNYKPQHLDTAALKVNKNEAYSRWELKNLIAMEPEAYSPNAADLFPVLWCTPEKFEYEGTSGTYENWESYGKWQWELNKGRQNLPEATKNEIVRITGNTTDIKEKVKIIYRFLQNKTRYVSIQLGIGGWRPFDASVVDEVSYGDCKALSNYMVSLLKAVDIESFYTLIGNGEQKIKFPDFPSMGQANHVIVCVPIETDTVWLECTNQEYPFGYIGKSNSGRYALLITETGGKLVKTPYPEKESNTQIRKAEVLLDAQGNATINVTTTFDGLQFSNRNFLLSEGKEEQRKWYLKSLPFNSPQLNSMEINASTEKEPEIWEKLNLYVPKNAAVSGNRIFIKPNILNAFSNPPPKLENRRFNVELDFAYTDVDTIKFSIPEGYIPESVPENVTVNTEFGYYSSKTEFTGNELIYIRKIEMNSGEWTSHKYDDFRNFYTTIWKADQAKAVLIKR